MKVSDLIISLQKIHPDLKVFDATGPSGWRELDENSDLQIYIGKNPKNLAETMLIFHDHVASGLAEDSLIPLLTLGEKDKTDVHH